MVPTPLLSDEHIRLRQLTRDDAEDIYACVHDPQVQRFTDVPPAEQYPLSAAYEFIANDVVGVTRWVVSQLDDPQRRLLGVIELRPYVGHDMEIGYYAAPWARRRGFMTRALTLVTEYALSAGAKSVILRVDKENIGGRALAEKCGYIHVDQQDSAGHVIYHFNTASA